MSSPYYTIVTTSGTTSTSVTSGVEPITFTPAAADGDFTITFNQTTSANIVAIGPGGAGGYGFGSGGGGGGGGKVTTSGSSLVGGTSYTLVVGKTTNTSVTGGTLTTITAYKGVNGSSGNPGAGGAGGAGIGGTIAIGINGSSRASGAGGAGGAGGGGGGAGGAGGGGGNSGTAGSAPGGGGGGGGGGLTFGGAGGAGTLTITFTQWSLSSPSSGICFPAKTPIATDQGIIDIDKLNPEIHTIRSMPIDTITKTISRDKYLVCFEKDALAKNIPSQKTIMSQCHLVFFNGKMIPANEFLYKFDNVKRVKYTGELLYNVLLETHEKMVVNNLICETLHPENGVAKLFRDLKHMNPEEQQQVIKAFNEYVIKNDLFVSKKTNNRNNKIL
jgi:hypothetical protein